MIRLCKIGSKWKHIIDSTLYCVIVIIGDSPVTRAILWLNDEEEGDVILIDYGNIKLLKCGSNAVPTQ